MNQKTKDPAALRIREQVRKLEAELKAILEESGTMRSKVKASRQQTLRLLEQVSDLATREGNLRRELAELHTALKGLEH